VDDDATPMVAVTSGLRFPEGPVAMDDGSVLVVEIEGGALTRVRPDGSHEVVGDCGGGPNGAAFGPDGAVYVCNDGGLAFRTEDGIRFPYALADGHEGGCLQRVDLATGAVEVVFTHSDGQRLGSLNDIVFDPSGWCWFVDTGAGAVHWADPVGGTVRVAIDGLEFPNGMGLSPDGTHLYVSETYTGRVLAWDVTGPGRVGPRTVLHSSEGEHGWDGLAVDGAGNVCPANLERSGITVIAPDGTVRATFAVPAHDPYVTNLCFGGPDGRTAFICSSGRGILYSMAWPWPGLRLPFSR
jgi:gluconolactonase